MQYFVIIIFIIIIACIVEAIYSDFIKKPKRDKNFLNDDVDR